MQPKIGQMFKSVSSNVLLESFLSLSAQGIIPRGRQRTLLCPSRMPTGLHNMCIPGLIVTLWPLGLQNSYNSFTICHNKAEALFIHYFPHSLCLCISSFPPFFHCLKAIHLSSSTHILAGVMFSSPKYCTLILLLFFFFCTAFVFDWGFCALIL